MSAITMVSPPASTIKKPCTSASCCSPSRLWKNIQILINGDQREEFRNFIQDSTKLPHIIRVLLTSRLSSNNPLVYKKKNSTIIIDQRIKDKFGSSATTTTDLNALEIALLQKHDHIAYSMILVLKRNSTPVELKQFLNHQWGKEKLSALHLASFWGLSKLVRLLLDCGADPFIQNYRQLRPIDCTTHLDTIHILKEKEDLLLVKEESCIVTTNSILMKKAEKSVIIMKQVVTVTTSPSPISFSSSSSSSSSFSSFSSFDYQHCWTPPISPVSTLSSNEEIVVIVPTFSSNEQVTVTSPLPRSPIKEKSGCFPRHSSSISSSNSNSHIMIMMNDNNKQEIVLQKQKKVHFDPQIILMDACIRGDKDEIIEIIQQYQDEIIYNNIRDIQNRSLLHVALMHGRENLLVYLHDKIDINHVDNDGWTCLHYAAALGLWRSLQFLTSLTHCNVNARTNHGLKVEDCPESDFGRRKCKIIMDKTTRNNIRNKSSSPVRQLNNS